MLFVRRHCQQLGFSLMIEKLTLVLLLVFGLSWTDALRAHGGVVAEEDLCIIEIGVFRAHFTVYQPETRASEEFCEDVPDIADAVFVLDYLHDSLKQVPVDFRIIRDVEDRTIYASWADVQAMGDLAAVTEFYEPPKVYRNGSMNVSHKFERKGWYIGIVTTRHPTLDRTYQSVFGFHVGSRGLGYWPLIILVMLLVQGHFWVSSGGYARWKAARSASG